jgi:predicted O-linked N-acetylglucosamine transferase (SPINDLY family)
MKILLAGKNGKVGGELQHTSAQSGEVAAADRQVTDRAKTDQNKQFHPGFGVAFDLLRKQRFGEAGAILDDLLPQAPEHPEIWHWLGFVRWRQGKTGEAQQLMERALKAQPDNPTFLVNLGTVLTSLGKPAAAVSHLQHALAVQPNLASAHNNLANALRSLGRIDAAGRHYEAALAVQPNLSEAHNNLANIRKEQGSVAEALRHYRQALTLRPDFREAFSNLLALTKLVETMSPDEVFALHRQFAEFFETPLVPEWASPPGSPASSGKLRIGYVSPDCHPAASFFLKPIWAQHDREQFEVYAYFDAAPEAAFPPDALSGITCRLMTGLPDAEVAAMVRADRIDILIDIAGHAGRSRILVFARKPAPVQITWLDYLGTTGLRAMDFRLTDRWADPAGAERYHGEALLNMPDGFCQWCYPCTTEAPPVGDLPAERHGHITFGSFNNPIKITPKTLNLWSRVLEAVPDSRLRCVGVSSDEARETLRRHFSSLGQEDRLEILPKLSYPEFLAACNDVDVALDTLLFSGATTTCDVLWMGVPVVTLPGRVDTSSSASRSTASILSCLGLQRLVADSPDAYVDIARTLASDLTALADLRKSLRENMRSSPLMDARGFTRALEGLLREAFSMVSSKAVVQAQNETEGRPGSGGPQ